MMRNSLYDESFFSDQRGVSYMAAREVLPIALKYVPAESLLDVGCGVGSWLSVALELGVVDALGIDGDYVPRSLLLIPPRHFRAVDLRRRFDIGRKFSLVISMEVAEHIPADSAETFVKCLTEHGDAVLFSAAIPGQGGTDHINEQWPDYWQKLFAKNGFRMFDVIRAPIWHKSEIPAYYRQNAYLFVRETMWMRFPALCDLDDHYPRPVALVHPELFTRLLVQPVRLRRILHDLPSAIEIALRDRVRKLLRR